MADRKKSLATRAASAAAKAAKTLSKVGSSRGSRPPTRACPVRGASRGNVAMGSAGQTFFMPEDDDGDDEGEAETMEESTVNARRQPTPPLPQPAPEVPRTLYQDREEVHEYDWQEQELREASQTAYCFSVIDNNNLRPLLVPAGRAYKRLTQLFYQNMTRHIDEYSGLETLTVSIDGWTDSFTKWDLAHALGIPASSAEASLPPCPDFLLPSNDNCFPHLNELYPLDNKGAVTRRTSMRQEMWLVDHFITKQVCPIGHRSERWAPLAQYLYCASAGYFLDAAELIFSTMWRVHCSEFNKKQGPSPLPYMRYISTLLVNRGYVIRPDELYYAHHPKFTAQLWRQSLKSCRNVVFIPNSDDEADTVHMKWTKYYAALPHLTPVGFVPWVPHAQRPPVQNVNQAGGADEPAEPQWDGINLPTTRVRPGKKRRAQPGEGTSAAGGAEEQASGTDVEQILAGMQGLRIGFEAFSGQFGEVPLSQRMDTMTGRIENVETQVQELRTDFTQYREQADQRYLEFQQYQQQQQNFQAEFQQQQEADFRQLDGNFYVTRHYEQQILRQYMTDAQLEEFNQAAEDMRDQQYRQRRPRRFNPNPENQ